MNTNKKITSGENRTQFNYWDDRAAKSYIYNGERFYTITAIPLYVRRRSELLKLIQRYIGCTDGDGKAVLDYGCGDGWYLEYFSKTFPFNEYFGTDISEQMIELARERTLHGAHFTARPLIPAEKGGGYRF